MGNDNSTQKSTSNKSTAAQSTSSRYNQERKPKITVKEHIKQFKKQRGMSSYVIVEADTKIEKFVPRVSGIEFSSILFRRNRGFGSRNDRSNTGPAKIMGQSQEEKTECQEFGNGSRDEIASAAFSCSKGKGSLCSFQLLDSEFILIEDTKTVKRVFI